ncbi:MAG: cytochrome c-type biogenesis protein [Acidimicrobiales bacterium]
MSSPSRSWWASRAAWATLAVIAVAVLAFGSVHPGPSPGGARAAQLDSVIKCPACEDLSIAQSDAPSSITLRHEVARFVAQGWSDGKIEAWVTARYGSDALLVPPTTGASEMLYIVPVAAVGVAAGGLGWYLWRRRQRTDEEFHPSDEAAL